VSILSGGMKCEGLSVDVLAVSLLDVQLFARQMARARSTDPLTDTDFVLCFDATVCEHEGGDDLDGQLCVGSIRYEILTRPSMMIPCTCHQDPIG
jgi:hypothetical protein